MGSLIKEISYVSYNKQRAYNVICTTWQDATSAGHVLSHFSMLGVAGDKGWSAWVYFCT